MSKKLSHCTTPWGPSAPASANVQLWRMHEKAGERGERKLRPDSKLPGGGLCLKKMNEGLQTPIISFIILNLKKNYQPWNYVLFTPFCFDIFTR